MQVTESLQREKATVGALRLQLRAAGIEQPAGQFRFHPARRWRFDLAFESQKLAVEIDGGVYVGGGHTRGAQFERDREKDAEAMLLGWRVLRVTPRHVKDGRALRWIMEALHIHTVTSHEWAQRPDRKTRPGWDRKA